MGKQGPCYHCGVTSTPLWRNGPPEKPVLCNACGSRWRTKGSLANYTPSRRDPVDTEELKVSKPRTIIFKPKEQFSYRRKQCDGIVEAEREVPYSGQNFRKKFEGDTSYRSSSGSATSYSESCGYLGTYDTNDLAGSAQSIIWDSLVPSKKRTGVTRPKPSPVEKLTKELHSILQEQPSYLSGSSEEDLLYECSTPIGSFEIGHGGVLVRSLDSKFVEEESEASSLPIDNKLYNINEAYSGSLSLSAHRENKRTGYPSIGIEKFKKSTSQLTEEHLMRISHEKLDILRDKNSPLSSIDLEGIANFEVFMKDTTQEEQHRLMRYLPSIDVVEAPESLKNLFQSPQFTETLSCFQQLLREGIFDQSFSGENIEEFRSLKRLVLLNTTKSKWVEHYQKIKDVKHNQVSRGKEIAFKPHSLGHSDQTSLKRPRDHPNGNRRELKGLMRSPKRVFKSSTTNLPLVKSSQLNSSDAGSKVIYDSDDFVDNEGDCVSPRSIFASPPDRSCMLAPLQFFGENTDQDLLMDAPRNAPFPEAELLNHPWSRKTNQDSNQTESGVADGEESLTNKPSSSFGSRNQRYW